MKNPKLISKPFAQNGQKNAIPENFSSSMESNQATWDTGFGQITMIPVAAGGLPPKGQDFNGIFNQLSENIVYLSKGGKFKFSADYAAAINGYPKGAILQSDDEKKEYQSLVDNNKVNFNTATQSQINAAWKLISTDDMLDEIAGKQPSGNYALKGDSYTKTESDNRFQPKGSYQVAGYSYSKTESDAKYATNLSLNNGLALKFDNSSVVQDVGTSTTKVMSQDASFKKFMKFGDYGFGSLEAVKATNSQLMSSLQSQLFKMGGGDDDNAFVNHGAGLLISYSASIRAGLFINDANGDLTVFRSRADIASGAIRKNKVYTDGNTATDRNGYLKVTSSVEELVGVPVGGSVFWNGVWDENSPLAEYFWPNEGRSFSAVAYPVAAKAFPSLRLPDDRGYAIRIADNGRGIDPGRIVGTYQEDAMQKIEGTLGALNDRAISYTGAFYEERKTGSNAGINGGGQENVAGFDSSRVVRTANETRMKNVAKILITRMK